MGFLNTETGWMNKILAFVGVPGPDWINNAGWVYPALTLIGLWGIGNFMLINIAGLQSVPFRAVRGGARSTAPGRGACSAGSRSR